MLGKHLSSRHFEIFFSYYDNTPIQIYVLKISPPNTESFSDKNSDIFSYFCTKNRLWVLIRTASNRLTETVLTSTHNLCVWAEIIYAPVNPSFTI